MAQSIKNQSMLIRADADSHIGTGHVMRCLALAQAWTDRIKLDTASKHTPQHGNLLQVMFVCARIPDALYDRLQNEGFKVVLIDEKPSQRQDCLATLRVAKQFFHGKSSAWIVLDGYHFDYQYQKTILQSSYKLMVIDDYAHQSQYDCNILLNQNLGADRLSYKVPEKAIMLAGPRYALLRREFRTMTAKNRNNCTDGDSISKDIQINKKASKVLVIMGGADTRKMSGKVLEALMSVRTCSLYIKVVAGAACQHDKRLDIALRSSSGTNHHIEKLSNVKDMPALLQWADIAITAAGGTCWELMNNGVPFVTLSVADNQIAVAESLERLGVALSLGWHEQWNSQVFLHNLQKLLNNRKVRQQMAKKGMGLVDGLGANRVVDVMLLPRIELRKAVMRDSRFIFELSNQPEIRSVSFSRKRIKWSEHIKWLKALIDRADTGIYVCKINRRRAGIIRFEPNGKITTTVSIALKREYCGKHIGKHIIAIASQRFSQEHSIRTITAYIKPDNIASQKAFSDAGYRIAGQTIVQKQPAVIMEWEKST